MPRFLPFAAILLLCACNTTKRAENRRFRGYVEYKALHRETFARDCAEAFPVVPTVRPGQTVRDTVRETVVVPGVSIPCPPPRYDSARRVWEAGKVDCPPVVYTNQTATATRTDTERVVDRAAEMAATLRADRLGKIADSLAGAYYNLKADRDAWKQKARTRGFAFWGLVCGIVLGLLLRVVGPVLIERFNIF